MSNDIGTLSKCLQKKKEWLRVNLPDGQSFKFLVKDHVSGNPGLCSVVIKCPKSLRIEREENENIGNH